MNVKQSSDRMDNSEMELERISKGLESLICSSAYHFIRSMVFLEDSTTKVADKLMEKVVGKPYWGKPDVRFDEGAEGRERYGRRISGPLRNRRKKPA